MCYVIILLIPHFLLSYLTNSATLFQQTSCCAIILVLLLFIIILLVKDKACMVALLDCLKLGQFTLILVYEVSLKDAETLFG